MYTDEGFQIDEYGNIHTNVNALNIALERSAIDAEPVRHGKWIVWDEILAGIYHTVSECSECGFTTDKMFREEMPYCPNCGADMRGEK
jgi:hypothetical protein